jgi:hypothetical protein
MRLELWDGSGAIVGSGSEPQLVEQPSRWSPSWWVVGWVGAGGGAIGVVHQLVGGVGARGSMIGVVQQSLRGAIGAVRLEPKAARLLGAVSGGVVVA